MESPDINAPSPEPDNDFDLPGDINFYNSNMNGFGSYLNNDTALPFDLNEFYRESPPPVDQNSIQVLNSQDQTPASAAPLNDFYNSLIPSKLEAYNPEMSFGSYQPPPPPLPSNFSNNTASNYMIAPPPPPATYNATQINFSPGIPLPPPSMNQSIDEYAWNSWNSTPIETPHSPPHFERKGHENNMIEYIDESLRTINEANDVDHRQLSRGESDGSMKDVDHRNLISLTGSPSQSNNKDSVSVQ